MMISASTNNHNSIHRRLGDGCNGKYPTKTKIIEEEEAMVVKCVTQDDEDEEIETTTPPFLPQQSPLAQHQQASPHMVTPEEGYVNQYERMLQRQEEEHNATCEHLNPLLNVLKEQLQQKTDNVENIWLKEFTTKEIKTSLTSLKEQDHYSLTDEQFVLVLKLLTKTEDCKISGAEILHHYKICVNAMQMLQHLPCGEIRNQAKQRTLQTLQLSNRNKTSENTMPAEKAVVQQKNIPAQINMVKTRAKQSNSNQEVIFLKMIVAFLMGLVLTSVVSAAIFIPATSTNTAVSIDQLAEQISKLQTAAISASTFSQDTISITKEPGVMATVPRPASIVKIQTAPIKVIPSFTPTTVCKKTQPIKNILELFEVQTKGKTNKTIGIDPKKKRSLSPVMKQTAWTAGVSAIPIAVSSTLTKNTWPTIMIATLVTPGMVQVIKSWILPKLLRVFSKLKKRRKN
jgi:hypothetical protein